VPRIYSALLFSLREAECCVVLRQVCVVKVINYKHMDFDESAVFNEIEALVLAKEARDPEYLTQYVDLFTSDGKLELVIAYWAEIAPLYDAVIEQFSSVSYTGDSQPFTEEAASKIIRSVLRGIKQLHDQDIVHCNLSPDTIFVNPSDMEQVYLADLSSATVCPPERFLTNQAGTPGYAAPEQLQLDKTAPVQFGRAADIWSVGVTMYQLLCGRPPFSGDNADAIKNVQEQKLVFDETWKRVSEKAMDLLKRKLLVRDPASRPNVAELLEDPWFTGAYFRTSSKKGATAGHDGGPSDTISGSVRRLHLSHAKRKLRAAIRVAIAQVKKTLSWPRNWANFSLF
jgi:serine/threonine protein kinase